MIQSLFKRWKEKKPVRQLFEYAIVVEGRTVGDIDKLEKLITELDGGSGHIAFHRQWRDELEIRVFSNGLGFFNQRLINNRK